MIRSSLLSLLAFLTVQGHAQRVVPVGIGAGGQIDDMAVLNGRVVVSGSAGIDLMGVEGNGIQSWDGNQVYTFPTIYTGGVGRRLVEEHNGELYAGGRISTLGNVARWNGAAWDSLDQGLPEWVTSFCVHQDQLHASTRFGLVCRWNGATWDTLGGRFNADVQELASHQNVLYAVGDFTADAATNPIAHIAQWNGSAWSQVGSGVTDRVLDAESTPVGLVVGGEFTTDGAGNALPGWAIWNGFSFAVPPLSPMPQYDGSFLDHGIAVLPDGTFVVEGYRVNGNAVFDLAYDAECAAEFDGHWLVGTSEMVGYTGHAPANAFSELIEGVHHTVVDAGAMRAMVTPTPALFEKHWMDLQGLEVPKDQGVHSVYSVSPLLIGRQAGVWKRSLPRYNVVGDDSLLWAGPQQATVRDEAFYRRYHQVWTLDQYTISQHAEHWNDAGYEMPYAIATWPGNGNTANGEPAQLAPFQDQDGDGLYEPGAGDHPLIRGDRAAYTILHSDIIDFNENDLDCDMHVMVYNYAEPSLADRYNSTFINLRIINRSGADYDSVRFGLFTDMDLGGFADDLSECDSTRGLWFNYNADNLDADTALLENVIAGYGAQPPAIGFKFLNQPMSSHSAWKNNDETLNIPELIEMLNGTLDGVPHVGPGYSSRFQFPGGAWSDIYLPADTAPDRRSLAACGPYDWAADDTLCFDLAVIHARATSGGPYASVTALKQRADGVQAWYDTEQFACGTIENVVAVRELAATEWSAYPNPTDGTLTLSGGPMGDRLRIEVLDAMGRRALEVMAPSSRSSIQIDLSALDNGPYVVMLHGTEGSHVVRVVKAD